MLCRQLFGNDSLSSSSSSSSSSLSVCLSVCLSVSLSLLEGESAGVGGVIMLVSLFVPQLQFKEQIRLTLVFFERGMRFSTW